MKPTVGTYWCVNFKSITNWHYDDGIVSEPAPQTDFPMKLIEVGPMMYFLHPSGRTSKVGTFILDVDYAKNPYIIEVPKDFPAINYANNKQGK